MGDVLRTTPLLRVLTGEIYWATKSKCIPLLPKEGTCLKQIIDINEAEEALRGIIFDKVISLDDDAEAGKLAVSAQKLELIGSFLDSSKQLTYTDSAKEWFDMGLISKLGREKADALKKNNHRTYQEIIFRMLGKEFRGEEYVLNTGNGSHIVNKDKKRIIVGIESRADKRWPTKVWNKYALLADALRRHGFEVMFFQQREVVQQYIDNIRGCDLVVSGDTLTLHLALALKIKAIALFTCTSPTEIYDYGRMIKIVSPLLEKAFYRREYIQEAVDAVTVESVYRAVKNTVETNVEKLRNT